MYKGEIDAKTATEHTVVDTAAVGIGGKLGAKAGLTVGLILAPVTGGLSAVVIPMATSLLGVLAGVFAGRGLGNYFKSRHLRAAVRLLEQSAERFCNAFLQLYDRVVNVSNSFYDTRLEYVAAGLAEVPIWRRWFTPTIETTFYKMAKANLNNEKSATHNYYRDLREKLNATEPSEGGMILFAQGPEVLNGIEPLVTYHTELSSQIDNVEKERKKLG